MSKSGYYRWQSRKTYKNESKRNKLKLHVKEVFDQSNEVYGYRRVFKELRRRDIACYRNQIAHIMRVNEIAPKRKRKFKYSSNSSEDNPAAPNLLKRNFTVDKINKVWVSDITYLWTSEGWLHLSVILDLGSRNVVSWRLQDSLGEEIVSDILEEAIEERKPDKGLIFHSDRGSQYRSNRLIKLIENNGYKQSMSRKANCWDNAVAESFFSTLKRELVYKKKFKTKRQARMEVFYYIEVFYKRVRLHSTIGDVPPAEYEKNLFY